MLEFHDKFFAHLGVGPENKKAEQGIKRMEQEIKAEIRFPKYVRMMTSYLGKDGSHWESKLKQKEQTVSDTIRSELAKNSDPIECGKVLALEWMANVADATFLYAIGVPDTLRHAVGPGDLQR